MGWNEHTELKTTVTHTDSPAQSDMSTLLPTSRTEASIALTALAFAALIGASGSGPWPIVRAFLVLAAGLACLLAQRHLGRRAAAISMIAFGLAGLIAGVGIGINHLVNDPISASATAGALTVIFSLVLVGLGSTRLIRAAHRWWKLTAVPIGIATLALVFVPLTLAVFVTNAPPFPKTSATPADHGLAYDDVELITADQVRLEGQYIASTNGASVILLGGISGVSDHEVEIAAMLARHGYGVLLLNVRGQGGSTGDFVLWGWWGEVDVAAGIEYLAHRPDVDEGRIGAIGMSVGGEQAIAAAGVDSRLRAVVSEGATARGARDEGDEARGVGGLLIRYIDLVSKHAASLMTDADPPTSLRESLSRLNDQRALLIAAGAAEFEIESTEALRAAAPDRVDMWIARDASHTGAFRLNPAEWERRVVTFLDGALERR